MGSRLVHFGKMADISVRLFQAQQRGCLDTAERLAGLRRPEREFSSRALTPRQRIFNGSHVYANQTPPPKFTSDFPTWARGDDQPCRHLLGCLQDTVAPWQEAL